MKKVENETVYVIYHNGTPFESFNHRIVYAKKNAASGQVTVASEEMAKNRRKDKDWYWLSREERKKLHDEVRKEFEVIEYTPKGR